MCSPVRENLRCLFLFPWLKLNATMAFLFLNLNRTESYRIIGNLHTFSFHSIFFWHFSAALRKRFFHESDTILLDLFLPARNLLSCRSISQAIYIFKDTFRKIHNKDTAGKNNDAVVFNMGLTTAIYKI